MSGARLDPARHSDLRLLLSEAGIAPRHALGQNFLVDPQVCDRIVAQILKGSPASVWEVGPGAGQLTTRLCEAGIGAITAFERDTGILPVLKRVCADCPALEIVPGDALRSVPTALAERRTPDVLAGNLPYGIAATLIGRVLRAESAPSRMVVMVQLEVAERMIAHPASANYSGFSVLCAAVSRPMVVLRVGPTHFHPRPRVDSAVVLLERTRDMPAGLPELVNRAFGSRRKTLRNNLLRDADREQMSAAVAAADISPDLRAEVLSAEDFLRILAAIPE